MRAVILLLLLTVAVTGGPNLSAHKLSLKQISQDQKIEGLEVTWPFFFILCMGVMIIMVYVGFWVIERREKRIRRADLERERRNPNRVAVPYLVLYDRRDSDLEAEETLL